MALTINRNFTLPLFVSNSYFSLIYEKAMKFFAINQGSRPWNPTYCIKYKNNKYNTTTNIENTRCKSFMKFVGTNYVCKLLNVH